MKRNSLFVFIPEIILLVIGYFIQDHLLLSGDVGYLIHASDQLLMGGHYTTDFFETNPPMILYLYAPIHLLTHYFAFSISFALRSYIFLLGVFSAGLCYFFLKEILKNEKSNFIYLLFYSLLIIFFILPGPAFGQREHLFILLTMPYLLAAVFTLQNKQPSYPIRFLIAFMAALGFSLKPFFLVTFGLIEGYIFLKKNLSIRLESIVIVLIFILYLISIYKWQRDYLTIILPLVTHYYLPFVKQSLASFFGPPYVLFCMGMIFSYLFFPKTVNIPPLGTIFFLALIGLFFAAVISRTSWYYHVLPALSMAYLLAVFYIGQLKYKSLIILLSIFIFVVPFYNYYGQIRYGVSLKKNHAMNQAAQFIRQSDAHTVYCIPWGTFDCFPFLAQMNGQYVERFPSFWWYTGLRHQEKKISLALTANQDKNYLIEQVVMDLRKAHWVIFNDAIFKESEVIAYLSENTLFRSEWVHYRYRTHFGSYQLYERINVGNKNDKSSTN